MNKALLITLSALVISLAVNAWQFSKQQNRTTESLTAVGSAPTKASGNHRDWTQGTSEAERKDVASRRQADAGSRSSQSLGEFLTIRGPIERYEALLRFASNLSSDEIGETLKELRAGAHKSDPETHFLTHLLLTRWGREDPDAALASLGNAATKQGGSDASTILGALAATDPARAVAWLNDPENKVAQQAWMGPRLALAIAEQWARQDPEAALTWAAGLPDNQRAGAYSGIIRNILDSDPERAAAVAMELGPAARPKLLSQVADAWGRQSPEEAVAWANSLTGRDRDRALGEALGGWAASAPAEAAAYLDRLPAEERPEHIFAVAHNWSQQAPADAAAWLGNQPESEGKAEAMGHLMWNWTTTDPEAAALWLGEQPAGAGYDNGVAGLAKAAAHAYDDPETAVTWAATIENEELRGRMTQHTLGRWMRQNPEAAQNWADRNGVEVPDAKSGGRK